MKKVFLFSLFLVLGLVLSQCLPVWLGEAFLTAEKVAKTLMFVCLAFIMINVGREFELDKTKWRSYAADYFIAMATAAVPWIMVAFYYMFLLPADLFGNWDAWKENLLLSRFAAPTSAGILFTMLAAAGLRREWIYKKTQVLAIFDDLDTILLMIPLQIFMIGFKWQLFAVVIVITFLLVIGWKKLGTIRLSQPWKCILFYAVCIVAVTESIYLLTKWMMGADGAIHIEVLLPAFVLGMVMKTVHQHGNRDEKITGMISYLFMFLVGLSTPDYRSCGDYCCTAYAFLGGIGCACDRCYFTFEFGKDVSVVFLSGSAIGRETRPFCRYVHPGGSWGRNYCHRYGL